MADSSPSYKIKDWKKFQHFKDRRPPWIKLYREILEDKEWFDLDPLSAKTLVMLWLLASEHKSQDGALPDIATISFRLRMTENQCKSCIDNLKHWLDITVISARYQDGPSETEREAEKETEGEGEATTPPAPSLCSKGMSYLEVIGWLKTCHHDPDTQKPTFADCTINQVHIENALRPVMTEKGKLNEAGAKALNAMAAHYAGTKITQPVKRIENYIAGKRERMGGQTSAQPDTFQSRFAKDKAAARESERKQMENQTP